MSDSFVLKTVEDAWAFFRGRVMDDIRAVDSGTMHIESTSDDDRVLAKLIQDREGEFEERMIAGLSEPAVARWAGWEAGIAGCWLHWANGRRSTHCCSAWPASETG
ncbi:hypothetical protein [Sorangium cellulosum]|uniref:hypothetical protein n=1 Tax=Sorangium cellulosum TaxID=56 RepID=UPI00031CE2F1|nr:hypothetical protein [Sorangium cellulosum]